MAFQFSALLNSYTVAENVHMALHDSPLTDWEKNRIVKEKLEMVGLDGYEDSMPDELSGGQQKRVSFARAIVHNPQIIFYDEPTAGLDPISSTVVEDYMNLLIKEQCASSIVVTHQHSTIRRTTDYVICLNKGHIVWEGDQTTINTDQNEYIRQFIDGKKEGPFS
jgi:phospholipid/cholesterol/gamma-HCH transport system ATP-binding protein